jgi:F0F1-type ATP synthase assembly protein I
MDDFDRFLEKSREKQPSEFQMKKWKKAVQQQNQRELPVRNNLSNTRYWSQMVAAVLVGIVVGGLLFGNLERNEKSQEIAYEDATIEVVYTKL